MTLAAAATYILVILWPDGSVTRENALSLATCQEAANAALSGTALPLDGRTEPALPRPHAARQAHCERPGAGEGFPRGWDCIATPHPTEPYHCRG